MNLEKYYNDVLQYIHPEMMEEIEKSETILMLNDVVSNIERLIK